MFVMSMLVSGAETLKTPFLAVIETSTVRFWHTRAAARAAKASGRVEYMNFTIVFYCVAIGCMFCRGGV